MLTAAVLSLVLCVDAVAAADWNFRVRFSNEVRAEVILAQQVEIDALRRDVKSKLRGNEPRRAKRGLRASH